MANVYPSRMERQVNNRVGEQDREVQWRPSRNPRPRAGSSASRNGVPSRATGSPALFHSGGSGSSPSVEEYGPDAAERPWESAMGAMPKSATQAIAKYKTKKRVGGGAFGDIYICEGEDGKKVAVKFEKHGGPNPQLRHEYKVLRSLQNGEGFAKVHHFSKQDNHDLLIMDLLGPSLEDQFNKCDRCFELVTVLMIADQLLSRIEFMHSNHLIHRDIKPANFVTCRERGKLIYCIDFGLAQVYRHPKTLQHIPPGRAHMAGTPRYASINTHSGKQQSRRDDLESIAYMLIYFLNGSLPWQGIKGSNPTEKCRVIMEKKKRTPIPVLCQGLPDEFGEFLSYVLSLQFDEEPDYAFCKGMFRELYYAMGNTQEDMERLDWQWNHVGKQEI